MNVLSEPRVRTRFNVALVMVLVLLAALWAGIVFGVWLVWNAL